MADNLPTKPSSAWMMFTYFNFGVAAVMMAMRRIFL